VPDPCQPIVDRLEALRAAKKDLQAELSTAPPNEKPALIQQIRQVDAAIKQGGAELTQCRATNPAPLRPDIGFIVTSCLPAGVRADVEEALNEAFEAEDGVAHSRCIDGRERLGVWAPSRGQQDARVAGLEFVNPPLKAGERIGEVVNAEWFRKRVRAGWDAAPKAYNTDMEPDAAGPIFLTDLTFKMQKPNMVLTTTQGFRRIPGPLPDVDFTATTTDVLSAEAGVPHVDSTVDVDVDFDLVSFLLEFFTGGPLGQARGLFTIGADIWDNAFAGGTTQGGAGASALQLFPTEIHLDTDSAVGITYRRLEVTQAGALLSGGTVSMPS
jgi:hypothetical protein